MHSIFFFQMLQMSANVQILAIGSLHVFQLCLAYNVGKRKNYNWRLKCKICL